MTNTAPTPIPNVSTAICTLDKEVLVDKREQYNYA